MGRSKVRSYLDIIVRPPELTAEKSEERIREEEERCKELTDWSEIN